MVYYLISGPLEDGEQWQTVIEECIILLCSLYILLIIMILVHVIKRLVISVINRYSLVENVHSGKELHVFFQMLAVHVWNKFICFD